MQSAHESWGAAPGWRRMLRLWRAKHIQCLGQRFCRQRLESGVTYQAWFSRRNASEQVSRGHWLNLNRAQDAASQKALGIFAGAVAFRRRRRNQVAAATEGGPFSELSVLSAACPPWRAIRG